MTVSSKEMFSGMDGKCIIFSAPSGAGKTTIVSYLLTRFPQMSFSISATSRLPRGKEENGVDYHFFNADEFKAKIAADDFVEWEEVYTNTFYGTLKSEIINAWENGKVVIFDVDAIGGINLKQIFGDSALSVFIKPPSLKVLKERLKNRQTETDEQIQMRIGKAEEEVSHADKFDYILLNDNLDKARQEAEELIRQFLK